MLISSEHAFIETSRMFNQISGYHCLDKLTHKINHHTNKHFKTPDAQCQTDFQKGVSKIT